MISGRNSWKGFVLLFYVVVTLCACIGCIIANGAFFKVIAALLLLCNGYVVSEVYKILNDK